MRKILTCLLLLNSLIAFSADTININVDANAEQFKITLPANPTTGFQWTLKQYEQTIFKWEGSEYQPSQTTRIGSGGEMCFTFSRVKHAIYPKSTIMLFRYARSWEHHRGIIKKVVVHFKLNQ